MDQSSQIHSHWFASPFSCAHTNKPVGSTSLASFKASELARSEFAGVTARMRQFSRVMNCMSMSLIWYSMSAGWSPTGTLVRPGKSTKVRFKTAGEGGEGEEKRKERIGKKGDSKKTAESLLSPSAEELRLDHNTIF